MILLGKVSKGTVILPPDSHLAEGTEVEVRPLVTNVAIAVPDAAWCFPEGRHLGAFRAPAEDWRLLANEVSA